MERSKSILLEFTGFVIVMAIDQSVTTNQDIVLYKQCFEKSFLKNLENYRKLPKCITVFR